MSARSQVALVAGGAALAVVVAALAGLPGADVVALLALAAGGALAAGAVGGVLLRLLRTAPLRAQGTAVALVAVTGTVVGVVLAANAMFVSSHDLAALLVVLVASGTVAALIAVRFELGLASRRLQDQLRRERAMEASRRELIAWVSHDLRTPLAGIRAMVEALEDGVVADHGDVGRYHAAIREEADRLAMLVDDLFELSRIEAGVVDLRFEPVTLDEVVAEAVAAAVPLAAAEGVRIERVPSVRQQRVRLAAGEIRRVVQNLLDNAIRHTPAGHAVEVRCDQRDGHVVVSVADACGGIPLDDLARVFEPAFRGDDSRGRDGGGGLGLAIARGLVGAHRGTIRVENDGPGCRFTVELPVG